MTQHMGSSDSLRRTFRRLRPERSATGRRPAAAPGSGCAARQARCVPPSGPAACRGSGGCRGPARGGPDLPHNERAAATAPLRLLTFHGKELREIDTDRGKVALGRPEVLTRRSRPISQDVQPAGSAVDRSSEVSSTPTSPRHEPLGEHHDRILEPTGLKAAGCADTAAGSRAAHGIGRCDAFKVHDELVVGEAGTFRRVAIPAAELDRR